MKNSLGFIGGGRITRILLTALARQDYNLQNVVVCEESKTTAEKLQNDFEEITISNILTAAQQDYLILALHPPVIPQVLEQIKAMVEKETLVISLAPKVQVSKIKEILGEDKAIVRVIPGATSISCEGYNPVFFSDEVTEEQVDDLLRFFTTFGQVKEVKEDELEAYAVISAMAPTYFWFQLFELVELGKRFGLNEEDAKQAVMNTMMPAVEIALGNDYSKEEVLDLIPVKPLGELEQEIIKIYRDNLVKLHEKLKP